MKDPAPPKELAESSRREPARIRSVRRRLFGEADEAGRGGSDDELSSGLGQAGEAGRRHRSRRRALRPGEQGVLGPRGTVVRLLSEDALQARHRWNFDFENERPLHGDWQWEKVGDVWLTDPAVKPRHSDDESDSDSDETEESDEESHPPQR